MEQNRTNSHASSLFHYTKSLDAILGILGNGFRFGYCVENFFDEMYACIPMISFCDIPIRQSIEHSTKYGMYAIGIAKDYLLENFSEDIAPVNYCLSVDSVKAAQIVFNQAKKHEREIQRLLNDEKSQLVYDEDGKCHRERELDMREGNKAIFSLFGNEFLSYAASRSLGLMKMYESVYDGKMQVNYDECEWRMVYPEYKEIDNGQYCEWYWGKTEAECKEWKKDRKILNANNLLFGVENISFIIVPSNSDIPAIIKQISGIDNICGRAVSEGDKALLYSKVISFEQIAKDF